MYSWTSVSMISGRVPCSSAVAGIALELVATLKSFLVDRQSHIRTSSRYPIARRLAVPRRRHDAALAQDGLPDLSVFRGRKLRHELHIAWDREIRETRFAVL